jgi:hypothetical protein
MKDSYMEEYLPFKSSPELLDEYIFSDGKIRTGKLLEGKTINLGLRFYPSKPMCILTFCATL